MWEILIFEVISATRNSNKFQKTRFWKEKSVEDVVILGPTAQATLVCIEIQCLHIKHELHHHVQTPIHVSNNKNLFSSFTDGER
jgi:hypothetical protein